jgi:hypothetical protein
VRDIREGSSPSILLEVHSEDTSEEGEGEEHRGDQIEILLQRCEEGEGEGGLTEVDSEQRAWI